VTTHRSRSPPTIVRSRMHDSAKSPTAAPEPGRRPTLSRNGGPPAAPQTEEPTGGTRS
jgi:hypothetical protein